MDRDLTSKAAVSINSSVDQVWDALVNPAIIKKYMMGFDTESDWQKGSAITWTGDYEGKAFTDTGTILDIEPKRLLQYTHGSSQSTDPKQIHTVTFELAEADGHTLVSLTQDNNQNEDEQAESTKTWQMMLKEMKKAVEGPG